jgi:hypothetical protein
MIIGSLTASVRSGIAVHLLPSGSLSSLGALAGSGSLTHNGALQSNGQRDVSSASTNRTSQE